MHAPLSPPRHFHIRKVFARGRIFHRRGQHGILRSVGRMSRAPMRRHVRRAIPRVDAVDRHPVLRLLSRPNFRRGDESELRHAVIGIAPTLLRVNARQDVRLELVDQSLQIAHGQGRRREPVAQIGGTDLPQGSARRRDVYDARIGTPPDQREQLLRQVDRRSEIDVQSGLALLRERSGIGTLEGHGRVVAEHIDLSVAIFDGRGKSVAGLLVVQFELKAG
mmetsp:Transcript_1035/g.1722  ORF Transcript_1035/g.1722 Transcript_1035/m.1722 type:complete len:221 (-) Transcript_1035:163-825(-)